LARYHRPLKSTGSRPRTQPCRHRYQITENVEDNLKDADKFNRITWEAVMGDIPYPSERNGADLRKNRAELLRKYKMAHQPLVVAQEK